MMKRAMMSIHHVSIGIRRPVERPRAEGGRMILEPEFRNALVIVSELRDRTRPDL